VLLFGEEKRTVDACRKRNVEIDAIYPRYSIMQKSQCVLGIYNCAAYCDTTWYSNVRFTID
jgi:hypothetical protein